MATILIVDDTAVDRRLAGGLLEQTPEQVIEACLQTVRVNNLEECYLRPLAFLGAGAMGVRHAFRGRFG